MLYYRIEGSRPETEGEYREPRHRKRIEIAHRIEEYWTKWNKTNEVLFLSDCTESSIILGAYAESAIEDLSNIDNFFKVLGYEIDGYVFEEIRFVDMLDLLRTASQEDYLDDMNAFLDKAEIRGLCSRFNDGMEVGENLIADLSDAEIAERAKANLVGQTFLPEYKRIRTGSKKKMKGHPCHYIVSVKKRSTRKDVCRTLLSALYGNGRLGARRYSFIDISANDEFSQLTLDQLYKSSKDSAIIVRFNCNTGDEEDVAVYDNHVVTEVTEKINQYKNRVLTIICIEPGDSATYDLVVSNLCDVNLVKINDDKVRPEDAVQYLRKAAKDAGVRPNRKLFGKLENGEFYDSDKLAAIFDNWYSEMIRKEYPQYSSIPTVQVMTEKKKKLSAYEEIQNLVGLDSAKAMLDKVINYYKGINLFRSRGLAMDTPSRHIVLTGNPGTCKTTFARLLSSSLYEAGALSTGAYVEVGKGDLCGRYVGWTAKIVKEKFKSAKGGVLFIDEAYALDEHGRGGSFAEEAINTIVQEMENHRDDVVVVFAGYPEPMEDFLKTNPGLRSRIAFHINMNDYSTEELLKIAELTACKKGMRLSAGAVEKLRGIFDEARRDPEYGAGRFVRNCIEQAKMTHISRLLESGKSFDEVTDEELVTIEAEDVSVSVVHTATREPRRIGFAS